MLGLSVPWLLSGPGYNMPPVQLSSDTPTGLRLWLDRASRELRLFWALAESENPKDPECGWVVWWWWCEWWRWTCLLFKEGDINAASFTKMDPCSSSPPRWPASCKMEKDLYHSCIKPMIYTVHNATYLDHLWTPGVQIKGRSKELHGYDSTASSGLMRE